MLFVDYSSAFNTIVPATLVESSRLWDWTDLCAAGSWTSWQAEVRWSEWATTLHLRWSSTLVLRRLRSQPTPVLPVHTRLYSYTQLQRHRQICRWHNGDRPDHRQRWDGLQRGGEYLTKWCQENHLSLNIDKTKELVVDFRRQSREHTPISIDKTPVERVNSFKFLGVHITEDLTWSTHTDAVLKKAHQRLFFLRRLRKLEWAPASSDPSTPALWRASWPAASPPGLETAPLATAKLCKGSCELPATLLEVSFPPSRTSTPGGV